MEPKPIPELTVGRLVLADLTTGLPRATLETLPTPESPMSTIRLSMLAPDGRVALVMEVDGAGTPKISVGPPGRGPAVIMTEDAIEIWAAGNAVATLWADGPEGRLDLEGSPD